MQKGTSIFAARSGSTPTPRSGSPTFDSASISDVDATPEERARLIELTERYCVVYQTLRTSPQLSLETNLVDGSSPQSPVGITGVDEAEAELQSRLRALRAAAPHAL